MVPRLFRLIYRLFRLVSGSSGWSHGSSGWLAVLPVGPAALPVDDYVSARIAGRPWTATESCCLARNAFDKRTPGLVKVEWRGDGFIGLCSKTYYCVGATDKYSTKGLSKRHNDIDKDTFLTVLTNRRSGGGFNRGFRVRNSSVMTYIQERAALTYFYGKRKVLADGLSTAPLEV